MTTPLSLGRILGYLGLAVLGGLVALAGALVQAGLFPGGLLLALAGCAAAFYGGLSATGSRVGVAIPAAFWLISVVLLSSTRPEGDFLFSAGTGSYLYLLGGVLIAVICATVPQLTSSGANRS
ncbi:MAG: hypothetical protein HOY76_31725 [Streptomyces sp.]|nr:hypothetical protein [Streptomyces sp.]NUS14842.1 hypothetical protein [Streptomyces sp.]